MHRILVWVALAVAFAQPSRAQQELWRVGTAMTLPQGWFDKGVFQPLRYGLAKRTELSTFPLLCIYAPNLAVKQRWYTTENGWVLSSKHGIYYPTRALNALARRDGLNVFPPGSQANFVLPSYHEALASKFLKSNTLCTKPDLLLTLKLGLKFAIGSLTESQMPPIEEPFVFHPTQPYYGELLWYAGADLEGHLTEFVNYSVDLNAEVVSWFRHWNVSHKGLLVLPWTDRWTLAAGYHMLYGDFPDGKWLRVAPLLDVSYKFRLRKRQRLQQGLFDKDRFRYDDFQEKKEPIENDPYFEYYPEEKNKKKTEENQPQ